MTARMIICFITEYDEKGKLIYRKSDGREEWYEYNEKGNEIHYKTSGRYEKWCEYDENGHLTRLKTSSGRE